ncbi:MAG: hypothetical protein AAB645_02710 [Patescibacteria group bacterium]
MSKKQTLLLSGLWFLASVAVFPGGVEAAPLPTPGMFAVSPTRNEIRLNPGESTIKNIYITNKLGRDADFKIEIEDISGTKNLSQVIAYYGTGLGPYSIKNYVIVNDSVVNVPAGGTKAIPIMISLPKNAKPGGFYGGVFFSVVNNAQTSGGAKIINRLGSLLFLRVKGEVMEKGEVKIFNIIGGRHYLFTNNPIDFQVVFANTGNIYLNPYGVVEIKNAKGQVLENYTIDPWFVFPDSERARQIHWTHKFLVGRYTASLLLNVGYTENHTETANWDFWIIPWWIIVLAAVSVIFIIIVLFKMIAKFRNLTSG